MTSSGHRKRPRSSAAEPPAARDWAGLPHDILLSVFLELGPCEIMRGAEHACTAWRRVAVGEPALWRRVNMAGDPPCPAARLRAVVDRSAGQCVAFSGCCHDDATLLHLVERSPSLKTLRLLDADAFDIALDEAIEKVPMLEHLEFSLENLSSYHYEKMLESVCQACPNLNKLKMSLHSYSTTKGIFDEKKSPIPVMRHLLSLELTACTFSVTKLMAIIDNCPQLESLFITCGRFEELQAKYTRVKILPVPDSMCRCSMMRIRRTSYERSIGNVLSTK
ncbi:hypothetical protein ACP70R_003484 [Stipagrostis hirtigluma subsp. patula]